MAAGNRSEVLKAHCGCFTTQPSHLGCFVLFCFVSFFASTVILPWAAATVFLFVCFVFGGGEGTESSFTHAKLTLYHSAAHSATDCFEWTPLEKRLFPLGTLWIKSNKNTTSGAFQGTSRKSDNESSLRMRPLCLLDFSATGFHRNFRWPKSGKTDGTLRV